MGNALKEWVEAVLNIVYPRNIQCMLCENELFEREAYSLCEECKEALLWLGNDTCQCCGRFMGYYDTTQLCFDCQNEPTAFRQNISVILYNEVGKQVVHQLKYGDQRYVAYHIGHMLADRIKEVPTLYDAVDFILPVPIHAKRLQERGFNQSEWIGKYMADRLQLDLMTDVLIRNCHTESQSRLNREERKKNLKGVFSVVDEKAILGKKILVVDDVFTTGSTIHEIGRELIKMGAYEVYSATFAAATVRER